MTQSSSAAVAVIGASVPGITGTVVPASDVQGLRFDPRRDAWTLSTRAGDTVLDLVVLTDGAVEVIVPQVDPRVQPPTRVATEDWPSAYRGMLVDGVPNLVLVDSDQDRRRAQVATLNAWLQWMYVEGATRITSRPPFTERWIRMGRRIDAHPSRDPIDLSNEHLRDEGVYAGHAVLRSGDHEATARVRLSGHMEPLDGNYHWYGVIDDINVGATFKRMPRGSVTVSVDGGEQVPAAVTDKTSWGTYRLAGVGAPPFPL